MGRDREEGIPGLWVTGEPEGDPRDSNPRERFKSRLESLNELQRVRKKKKKEEKQ